MLQFFFGAGSQGLGCAYLDLAPRFSGTYNACGNTVQSVAGICGPLVVASLLTALGGLWGWRLVWMLNGAHSAVSLLHWAAFQSSAVDARLNTPVKID